MGFLFYDISIVMNELEYRYLLQKNNIEVPEESIQIMMEMIGIKGDISNIQLLDDVIVIDDIVDIETQNSIQNYFLNECVWEEYNSTLYDGDKLAVDGETFPITKNTLDTNQLVKTIIFNNKVVDECNVLDNLIGKIPVKYEKILRIKANLTSNTPSGIEHSHSPIHTDIAFISNYITCIYYINDSDGDTLIFKETKGFYGQPNIMKRITPKKGRFVAFNGNHLHCGELPTINEKRIVLNINIS